MPNALEIDRDLSKPENQKSLKLIIKAVRDASGPQPTDEPALWNDIVTRVFRYEVWKAEAALESAKLRTEITELLGAVETLSRRLKPFDDIFKYSVLNKVLEDWHSGEVKKFADQKGGGLAYIAAVEMLFPGIRPTTLTYELPGIDYPLTVNDIGTTTFIRHLRDFLSIMREALRADLKRLSRTLRSGNKGRSDQFNELIITLMQIYTRYFNDAFLHRYSSQTKTGHAGLHFIDAVFKVFDVKNRNSKPYTIRRLYDVCREIKP